MSLFNLKQITLFPIIISIWLFLPVSGSGIDNNSKDVNRVLKQIETEMSSIKTLSCSFVQEKKISIMKKPIIITGRIFIQAPNHFAWHSSEPVKYSLVIKGHILKQWDEDSDHIVTIDLKSKPVFEVMVTQMKSWFSGNYTKQAEDYNIEIVNNSPVMLKFYPKKSSTASEYIDSIEVIFGKNLSHISNILIHEKSGDSMSMTFSEVKLNTVIPSDTWSIKGNV